MFKQKGVERLTMVHGKKIEGQDIAIYFETWEKTLFHILCSILLNKAFYVRHFFLFFFKLLGCGNIHNFSWGLIL